MNLEVQLVARLTVLAVNTIDTPNQSFIVNIYTCVTGRGIREKLEKAGVYETFNPYLEWLDSSVVESISPGWKRFNRDDNVEWCQRAIIKFNEKFELQHFPFDWQSLSMTLSSMYPIKWDQPAPVRVGLCSTAMEPDAHLTAKPAPSVAVTVDKLTPTQEGCDGSP
ncbi:hypothetical protein Agub_g2833 [Astrephomene gubernaculifera]|uniref:Uncharacterized protein n=1 Tax=Astrephomene gubernaculifera TaxID=47775 RepID=A0AAD3DJR4_9CHLO|nr:hypothetical protein Agub_g2833 [Astrephomene gubernaculifera]